MNGKEASLLQQKPFLAGEQEDRRPRSPQPNTDADKPEQTQRREQGQVWKSRRLVDTDQALKRLDGEMRFHSDLPTGTVKTNKWAVTYSPTQSCPCARRSSSSQAATAASYRCWAGTAGCSGEGGICPLPPSKDRGHLVSAPAILLLTGLHHHLRQWGAGAGGETLPRPHPWQ